jgi:hypothetical protein
LSTHLQASDLEYDSIELTPAPEKVQEQIRAFFEAKNLHSMKDVKQIDAMGINQIFFDDAQGYVTVKYDVESELPVGRIMDISRGKLLHLQLDEKVTAFYFRDLPDSLVQDLASWKFSAVFKSILNHVHPLPSAKAGCEVLLSALAASSTFDALGAIGESAVGTGLMACLKGSEAGALSKFDLSPIEALGNEAKAFWANPTKRISDYYNAVDGTVRGFFSLVHYVGGALMNPAEGLQALKAKFGPVGEQLAMMISLVQGFPPTMAVNLACAMITSVGIDTIINAMVGGAATGLMVLKIKKMMTGAESLQRLFSIMKRLKLKSIEQIGLTSEHMSKIFQGIILGKVNPRSLNVFASSLEDGSGLARSMALRGLTCPL